MATWNIDPVHSEVTFKVKHLVISTVTGSFKKFSGKVESDKEDFSDARVQLNIDVASVDTGNEHRDGHLKSADFLDVANHPNITFVSNQITKKGDSSYELRGDFTIRGITKTVNLQVEFGGIQKDFYGNTVAGFEITSKVNRMEFGLHWNGITEAGGIVVSDEVRLFANVELVKEVPVAATATA